MAGRKGKSGSAPDRQGGIAKAKEAAARGASERAAERAAGRDGAGGPAQRAESPSPRGTGGTGGGSGRDEA